MSYNLSDVKINPANPYEEDEEDKQIPVNSPVETYEPRIKQEPAKLSILGQLPGEAPTTTRGQDIAIGTAKAILPDPTNVAEIAQEFTELASDMWKAKNPYRGGAWYATKKLIKNSPEAARALKIAKEAVSPYIQKAKTWLQEDQLEPVYAGIENLTGIQRRVVNPAEPLMIKRSSTSINDKLVEQGSKNLNKGKRQLNVPKVEPPPKKAIQQLHDAHDEVTDLIEKGTKEGLPETLTKDQYKAKAYNLHITEGLDMKSVKKQMGGYWIDPKDGTEWAVHTDKGKGVKMIGRKSRGTRDIKRKQMTLDQSTGVGEDTFVKYDSKGNISDLLIKEGDEIHHWNSLIDKSPAYDGLSRKEAQELTTMVREAGWFFGDNKGNLIKMTRGDHKAIHAWMRKNGIEGAKAQKLMAKYYKGKSVKERFEILEGFMEYVQGGVDEELIRMGYKMPSSHKAAQKANRAEQLKQLGN